MTLELDLDRGWVADDLRAEFPELALVHTEVTGPVGRSPAAIKHRLRQLSDRFTGAWAVNLRQQPVPWAYRVFFRQVGIDPDEWRTPAEQVALDRMFEGHFRSRNLLDDGLVIATVETGVAMVAFDRDRVEAPLGLRIARGRERLGGDGRRLSGGELVIAGPDRAVAVLFGDLAEGRGVEPKTERIVLAAVQVKGVPDIIVEEALWTVVEVLAAR